MLISSYSVFLANATAKIPLLVEYFAMFEADLSEIKEGDIVGLTMYNSVHNIGFVDEISGGIIKLHTLLGQTKMAFSQDYGREPDTPEQARRAALSPERLNGPFAKGMSIGSIAELPDRLVTELRALDCSLKGKSALQCKILVAKKDEFVREALGIMRTAALQPQIELPGMRL